MIYAENYNLAKNYSHWRLKGKKNIRKCSRKYFYSRNRKGNKSTKWNKIKWKKIINETIKWIKEIVTEGNIEINILSLNLGSSEKIFSLGKQCNILTHLRLIFIPKSVKMSEMDIEVI